MAAFSVDPKSKDLAHSCLERLSPVAVRRLQSSWHVLFLFWTGRQGRPDKRGKIPAEQLAILERLGIEGGMWCDLVWSFKKYFGRSRGAGSPDRMHEMAVAGDLSFHPGQRRARACFASG